jgi:probable addiction module antidote protein
MGTGPLLVVWAGIWLSVPAQFTKAVDAIAGARGIMQLAHDTGITREEFYKALDEQGNFSFETVAKTMHALELQFNVRARSANG